MAVLVALAVVLVVPATRIAEQRLVDSTATRVVPSPEPTPTATTVVDDFDITAANDDGTSLDALLAKRKLDAIA